jgi:hypothetical protein
MQMKFENPGELSNPSYQKQLSELVAKLDLESPDASRKILFAQLQKFEAEYKMTSEDMFSSADCVKRELDPDLDKWATLYRCYKEIGLTSA